MTNPYDPADDIDPDALARSRARAFGRTLPERIQEHDAATDHDDWLADHDAPETR